MQFFNFNVFVSIYESISFDFLAFHTGKQNNYIFRFPTVKFQEAFMMYLKLTL